MGGVSAATGAVVRDHLLVPRSHRLGEGQDVDLAEVAGEPWVDTASAPGHGQAAALDACRAGGSR